jgi:hypothetical protein
MTFVKPYKDRTVALAVAPEKGLVKSAEGCWKADCPDRTDECNKYESMVEVATCEKYYDKPRTQ